MAQKDDVQLVTFRDAAQLFGMHPNTLRKWAASGKLKVVKLGGKAVRIPLSELQRMVREGLDQWEDGYDAQ
jgi:excisionase family DNA binding protein